VATLTTKIQKLNYYDHSHRGMSAVTCLSDMVAILSCSIIVTYKLLKTAHYKDIPVQQCKEDLLGFALREHGPGQPNACANGIP